MMRDVLFIGDAVTASGFRLSGWPVAIAGADLETVFDAACESAWLILITAAAAARLPAGRVDAVWAQGQPLLMLLPDATGGPAPEDISAQLRATIGPST
jgi:vacuolar-type H+-ATPase subunit F/Vma7